jgi:hypothetical protein
MDLSVNCFQKCFPIRLDDDDVFDDIRLIFSFKDIENNIHY